MPKFNVIKVGKPFSVELLHTTKSPRVRKTNPRDADLERLINEVSAGPESQVWPWELGDEKRATARAAASRIIRRMNAQISVGSHRDFPNALLFSRSPLRRKRKSQS